MSGKLTSLLASQDMTQGSPSGNLIRFSVPLLIGNLAQQLYSTVDSIVVGAYVGDGALAPYVLRQNLVGCLLCSFAALALIDGVRIAARLLAGRGELAAMLGLAGREILWSLVFVFPVYALFLWVFRRVPKKTVL